MNLFAQENNKEKHIALPLAERMRPKTLEGFFGQNLLTGEGKILNRILKSRKIFSMILWGPPGSGKTTLAKLMANYSDAVFFQLNAVASGVKDVRKVIEQAQLNRITGKSTILFIDEIHRFNKAQQDALLHAVEDGSIILVGATTENPSFEVISPLLSRCRVLKLEALSLQNLEGILDNAFSKDEILKTSNISLEKEAQEFLIRNINGDARKLLNGLEIAFYMTKSSAKKVIDISTINEALQQRHLLYDKNGDYHYDIISAFIKSVRGSDPDAAMYWLALMLEGGEKPEFIARRLIILASEDVGNANPSGLMLANSAFEAVHNIGMPEAGIILAQITTYLASSPKSNASYNSLHLAKAAVKNGPLPDVPLHLRNAPTKMMKSMDYGKNYKYAHDFENHFVKQNYFPDEVKPQVYYKPTELGREAGLKSFLESLWPERYKK